MSDASRVQGNMDASMSLPRFPSTRFSSAMNEHPPSNANTSVVKITDECSWSNIKEKTKHTVVTSADTSELEVDLRGNRKDMVAQSAHRDT